MRSSETKQRQLTRLLGLVASMVAGLGLQASVSNIGSEYPLSGDKLGDQLFPSAALGNNGGYVVWQDNHVDGYGLGIAGRKLDANGAANGASFKINQTSEGDQENAQVAMFDDGSAVVVWQSGALGFQDIFARYIGPDGTFSSGDILVNSYTAEDQRDPSVAVLANGEVAVVWGSQGQEPSPGSLQGVYGQILDGQGEKVGDEFLVNEYSVYNQRNPDIAALPEGGFVVSWISEKFRGFEGVEATPGIDFDGTEGAPLYWVDVRGRIFDEKLQPGDEFLVNQDENITSRPSVAANDDSIVFAWTERNQTGADTNLDVSARAFNVQGQTISDEQNLNAYKSGDQYSPDVIPLGDGFYVVWTSIGQDSNMDEIYGIDLTAEGEPVESETRANTEFVHKQFQPAVASRGDDGLVVWSSFSQGDLSFDVQGQRVGADNQSLLSAPAAPFVHALSSSRLGLSWPSMDKDGISGYKVTVADTGDVFDTADNGFTLNGLGPSETIGFSLQYVDGEGAISESSNIVYGTTWGSDESFDGLPDDWQQLYFGEQRPAARHDSDLDGATNLEEFLAGTDPSDANDVLALWIEKTDQGPRLYWNAVPGNTYQIQYSGDLESWNDLGDPRFAADELDSIPASQGLGIAYYRMIKLR